MNKSDDSGGGGDDITRVALWGYGNQNQLMAKYLCEDKRYRVVSVVSHHHIGKDYAVVESTNWGRIVPLTAEGTTRTTGVIIVSEEDAPAELERTRPDVCILATRTRLAEIAPSLRACAAAWCNVITIAEEMIYSWPSAPELTEEMDALFRQRGVTLTGSGFEDVTWCHFIATASSVMIKINSIRGTTKYNVDEYGAVLAEEHGVGLSEQEFRTKIAGSSDDPPKSFMYNFNEWIVSAMGLKSTRTTEDYKPIISKRAVYSKAMGRAIAPGLVTGMSVTATTETEEGVTIALENLGKCYEDDAEKDYLDYKIEGEPAPGAEFEMRNYPSPQMTNTAVLSRIPAVINAPPGYVSTDQFVKNIRKNCLNTYVNRD